MMNNRDTKSLHAVNLGLVTNLLFSVVKTTFGIFGYSPALLVEGINSTSDGAALPPVSFFARQANQPAATAIMGTASLRVSDPY